MNWMLVIAGALAVFGSVGHLTIGRRRYLRPMMAASFDRIPKKVLQAVFHYITVNFIASAILLLAAGFGLNLGYDLIPVALFIAIHFLLYTLVQLLVALTSGIPKAPLKLFQWTVFLPIGVFALIGVIG